MTARKKKFQTHEGAKFSYGFAPLDDEPFIKAHSLLFEKGIKPYDIEIDTFKDEKIIFVENDERSMLPFDIFAAGFYLVSRYEEYLPYKPDSHNRFSHESSIAHQNGFLRKPIVNIWARMLSNELKKHFTDFETKLPTYKFIPTYDIDIAYSYKYKGILRNGGRYLLSLKNFDFKDIVERTKVLFFKEKDPYDTYQYLQKLHEKHKLSSVFFFLIGEYAAFDKNISIENRHYQDLIQSIGDTCDIGIHPSYRSNKNVDIVKKEIAQLNGITKREVIRSRQHFVKLSIPTTYENLIELDILKDYSMGYPSAVGFRAGIASSFYFYNISIESKTNLRVYPFVMMDVSMRWYNNYSPEKAVKVMGDIIKEVKKVNGLLMTVWHNHTLSNCDGWEGWRDVFEQITEKAASISEPRAKNQESA